MSVACLKFPSYDPQRCAPAGSHVDTPHGSQPDQAGSAVTGTCLGSARARPFKTRRRGSTRGCKLRCWFPTGPGWGRAPGRSVTGAPTGWAGGTGDRRGHGHRGPGGHGHGASGLGPGTGDRGAPLGAAPSRPAAAARPYRDFLGVLFAVGGEHPGRGAPPCGLPQLVVTGRKAVFLRGRKP